MVSFFLLPRSPERARFLTGEERVYVVSILERTGSVSEDESQDKFDWNEVIYAIKSPHVWLLVILEFFSGNAHLPNIALIDNGTVSYDTICSSVVSGLSVISLSDTDAHVGSFEPTIVAGLGYAGNRAQLMSVPPFVVTFPCTYSENEL